MSKSLPAGTLVGYLVLGEEKRAVRTRAAQTADEAIGRVRTDMALDAGVAEQAIRLIPVVPDAAAPPAVAVEGRDRPRARMRVPKRFASPPTPTEIGHGTDLLPSPAAILPLPGPDKPADEKTDAPPSAPPAPVAPVQVAKKPWDDKQPVKLDELLAKAQPTRKV